MSRGHTLVIPKVHAADLLDISAQSLHAVMDLAQQVAKRQMDVLGADGITVWQNNRAAGGQEVFHFHVHVIPRWSKQKLVRQQKSPTSVEELIQIANLLSF